MVVRRKALQRRLQQNSRKPPNKFFHLSGSNLRQCVVFLLLGQFCVLAGIWWNHSILDSESANNSRNTVNNLQHPARSIQSGSGPSNRPQNITNPTSTYDAISKSWPMSPYQFPYHDKDFQRPRFEEVVTDHRNNVIVGDLQFLLDFAIVGYAKCGTSTMMEWLGQHPQVLSRGQELPHLTLGKIGLFAKNCYNLDTDPTKLRAYKNPTDVQNLRAIRLLREYFPRTRLLIGIRHPIWWFQSFYNYRIQNSGDMPPAIDLKGTCFKRSQGVCVDRASFHLSLARLGKTNYTAEKDAFTDREYEKLLFDAPPRSPNPVFLYETQQLADKDAGRSAQFQLDVQAFLGFTEALPPVHHYSPGKSLNATLQAERDAMKIRICDDSYEELRKSLLDKAKKSAYYIRRYFSQTSDVFISSPDYFLQLLDSYETDPCQAT